MYENSHKIFLEQNVFIHVHWVFGFRFMYVVCFNYISLYEDLYLFVGLLE